MWCQCDERTRRKPGSEVAGVDVGRRGKGIRVKQQETWIGFSMTFSS